MSRRQNMGALCCSCQREFFNQEPNYCGIQKQLIRVCTSHGEGRGGLESSARTPEHVRLCGQVRERVNAGLNCMLFIYLCGRQGLNECERECVPYVYSLYWVCLRFVYKVWQIRSFVVCARESWRNCVFRLPLSTCMQHIGLHCKEMSLLCTRGSKINTN